MVQSKILKFGSLSRTAKASVSKSWAGGTWLELGPF
jgi:hypothetical protein